jgi:hypothetical protein
VFSRLNPIALQIRGRPLVLLELTDQTVRCTILGKRFGFARWLGQRLQMPDLEERLKTERVAVFEFPHNGYEINWPKYDMGTLFEIGEAGARPWTVSFTQARDYHGEFGRGWWDAVSMFFDLSSILAEGSTSGVRDQWRKALDPIGGSEPGA